MLTFPIPKFKNLNQIRATFRFILLISWGLISTIVLLFISVFSFFLPKKNKLGKFLAHKYFNLFLRGVHFFGGMKIHWHGEPPKSAHVMMGNHRSYVDAVVLPVSFPVVFVARHETKSWPMVGWGASLLGTIWVKRDKKESRRATRAAVRDRLGDGYGVVIFPEGTTAKGPELLPYHKGMFYTCAENSFPIAPAAIEFKDPDLAWVNREMFIPHAFRHFGMKKVEIHVSFGPSFSGTDAEQLLEDVRNWTQKECYRLRKEIDG